MKRQKAFLNLCSQYVIHYAKEQVQQDLIKIVCTTEKNRRGRPCDQLPRSWVRNEDACTVEWPPVHIHYHLSEFTRQYQRWPRCVLDLAERKLYHLMTPAFELCLSISEGQCAKQRSDGALSARFKQMGITSIGNQLKERICNYHTRSRVWGGVAFFAHIFKHAWWNKMWCTPL